MAPFSKEDTLLINECKGYNARQFITS